MFLTYELFSSGRTNHSAHIAMAIFAAAEGYHDSSLEGLCDGSLDPTGNSWAMNVSFYLNGFVITSTDK